MIYRNFNLTETMLYSMNCCQIIRTITLLILLRLVFRRVVFIIYVAIVQILYSSYPQTDTLVHSDDYKNQC